MDPVRLGRSIRALRRRLGWRQVDLAERASVAQQTVSDVERGRAATVGLPLMIRVATALDADVDVILRWRGGALDRLLDERHAALCAAAARRLRGLGYEVLPEASYAYYGERGSVDVLGWHPSASALVVVEVKTELTSLEATLRKHDEKVRLGPRMARDRFGRTARTVAGILVLGDDSTSRRRVERLGPLLEAAYPMRGRVVWAVLAAPRDSVRGLVFLSPTTPGGVRVVPVSRVRRSRT